MENNLTRSQKVLFLLQTLEWGGAERVVVNVANGFAARGYDVTILLGEHKGDYLSLIDDQISVCVLNATTFIQYIRKLPKFLKKKKYTHIISASHVQSAALIFSKRIQKIDAKIIATLHYDLASQLSILPFKNRMWLTLIYQLFICKADQIIAVSNGAGKGLCNVVNKELPQLQTIYNPVFNNSIFELAAEPIDIDLRGRTVLVTVGILDQNKNQIVIIKALEILIKEGNKKLHLLVIGSGSTEDDLITYVQENNLSNYVSFLGFQKNPFKFLSKSDLFVFASNSEGFANVIVEALALGVNVVSTDCPSGPAEILKGTKYGWLANVNDAADISIKIKEALADRKPAAFLKERSLAFHSDKILQEYVALLN